MNTQERMDYILNNRKYIQMYMNMHDEEVRNKSKPKTFMQKVKGLFKW